MRLREVTDDLRSGEVVVVGDAILDCWLDGPAQSLCREAPVPVIAPEEVRTAAGGAANAAANVAALGGTARLVTVFGSDEDGTALRAELDRHRVSTEDAPVLGSVRTPAKRRLVGAGRLVARFDQTGTGPLPADAEDALCVALRRVLAPGARVLVCDYGLGTLTDRVRDLIAGLRDRLGSLAVDAHDPARWASARPSVITPDLCECATLLGEPVTGDPAAWVVGRAADLLAASGAESVAATLAENGAVLLRPGRDPVRVDGTTAPPENATGAGDTFAAALALAGAAGLGPETALAVANLAARAVLGETGTTVCRPEALVAADPPAAGVVVDAAELDRRVAGYRSAGRTVVFTNGCFDVLHGGHVAYLRQARELGDVLVVGLNDDASVRAAKGPDRPVNGVDDRARILAELRCVDLVCPFAGERPDALLEIVRPDLYVKGGDYTPDMLPETPLVRRLGGEIRIVDYVPHRSTTRLIARMRAQTR